MSDDASPRLSLPCLAAGQAQKEVLHNEALQILDALVQPVALSADLSEPPAAPAPGACWIVAAEGRGAWVGQEGLIAQWTAGGWRFVMPSAGWRCHILDRGAAMVHDGSAWRNDVIRTDGIYIDDMRVIGSRSPAIALPTGGAIIDNEARLVINEILAILRGHGLIES
jgi:hypothetical protein